ncbi:MAG: GntR family transcriptional regulator [Clostridia bacterium]|nr:GntR family transcriptional regulator [Clostridia bacterium]
MSILDTNNAVPLFEQVKLQLLQKLEDGIYPTGARMPSEAELCEKYNVSRITIRRAVNDLVEDGYLERRQGKGTFVATKRTPVAMLPLDDQASVGFSLRYKDRKKSIIISEKEYAANSHEQQTLHLQPNDTVLVLYRQILVDGKPWMLDRATYPAKKFPGFFEQITDDTSTYAVLSDQYGVSMVTAHREISLAYATNEQARLLDLAPGAPLFKTFKLVCDRDGNPVHMSYTYSQAENVVITLDNCDCCAVPEQNHRP